MAAVSREGSVDRDGPFKHSHNFSEGGRSSVPMWDSSDPDRAPPPLPMNPGTNGSPTVKPNTSASIAAAAKQIVEKARESAPLSSYTTNHTPQGSPERSLIKGAHHKRMQSLQPGSVKDLRSYLDNNRSPERSPERQSYMTASRQTSTESLTSTPDRSATPTPSSRDALRDTPMLRPSARQPPRAILGENTPPSATMLALQTMQVPDIPLSDVTNGPSTPTGTKVHTNLDFSSQLLNLTTIATNLQKEMAQLSRRSKDNATDLISLKEATNARDEDIRKSLRDLATSVNTTQVLLGPPPVLPTTRRGSGFGSSFMGDKLFSSPPSASAAYAMPRSQSAHGFLEEPRCGSPSPYSVEGAASVAMLEKIIREMVTKEGNDRLLTTLSDLVEKSSKENVNAARKIEQLSNLIKEKSGSQALVHVPGGENGPFDSPRGMGARDRGSMNSQAPPLHDDIYKMLQRIKDSVANSGGMTSEVKGLVRDMRGEVLGTGRELGQKLDRLLEEQAASGSDRSISDNHDSELSEEIHRIVEDGISDLKAQLSQMIQQRNEQDDDTFRQLASTRSMPNGDEMLSVVQHALAEHSRSLDQRDAESVGPGLDRDGVLDAVKEGLKDFEPNIELQQFGLERDEILAVLKEGLEDYQNNRPESTTGGLDKGEIYEVMQEALKDFQPPLPDTQITQMKEELVEAVRQALAEFQPTPPENHVDHEAMHEAVLDAVREGFANQGPAAPRELEISRDDLFDAVKASLDGSSIPFGGLGEQVLEQLHELIDGMRAEFKQYSAANGRDTEQVLDAVKDGLESLRAEIETYVDRAQDVTGKDEIVDTVKGGLEQLRSDVQGYCLQGPSHDGGKAEMLEYIKAEFEHLHEAINDNHQESSRGLDNDKPNHTAEIILAINEGMHALKSHVETRGADRSIDEPSLDELSDAMRVEFEQLKGALLQANASDKNELLETIQDSIGALHTRLNGSELGSTSSASSAELTQIFQEELNALKESIHAIVSDVDTEAIVGGVRQSIDELRTQIAADQSDSSAEIIGTIKEELERFNESIGSAVVVGHSPDGHKEALDAIHASLEDVKATTVAHGSRGISDDQLEAIRGEFENIRSAIANSSAHSGSHDEVLDAVRLGLDDLRSHLDKKLDNPEAMMSHQEEIIDALNDGLENLRGDIVKTLDKPLDMTVNYEILDTLKDGLAGLRASMDKLAADYKDRPVTPRGGEIVLAEAGEVGKAREVPAAAAPPDGIKRTDLEKMEVLLAQLQIKVEAMDHTLQELPAQQTTPSAPEDSVVKENLASIEAMIRDLQETVGSSTPRAMDDPEGVARKEDTDAIETLLRNTKAQLDDMAANPVSATTKEQLDEIHAVLRVTNESLDDLSDKLENSAASKTDVAVVEVLAQDLKTVLDELKEKVSAESSEEKPEVVTKSDIDVLGVLVTEVKANVAELNERAPEQLSKADFEALQLMISDFRESHDKLKDSYETDIAVTAKAFDDRKREFDDTLLQINEVKNMLDEIKVEVLEKLNDGEVGINTLGVALKGIEVNTSNEQSTTEIKEFIDTVKDEFERAHSSLEALKSDHAQASESSLEKQSEHKEALITELSVKLDALFDGLMSKYDDAQLAAEEKARAMEDKAMEQEQLMNVTKALADDLKLSIDTLGTTLSAFMGDLPATVEKMAEENKTVFAQVEKTHSKLEETAETFRDEHASTRDQVAKILAAVDCVQGDLTENHPRIMVTLEEVRALITQHYTHSQTTAEAAAEHAKAVKDLQDALKAGFEDTRATTESLRSQNEELKTTLPALMPPPIESSREAEHYDDTAVHDKLDKLMGHLEDASSRSDHMERLDQIHEKVMATAAEVSAFVVAQNKQITADHESKEKEADELALLLERRLERKDQLEADITVLNEEKESLQHAVEALKAEKEAMLAQKARLNADLSSVETALHIRRDELHEMDEKAHTIERRMMEGVMNQSRMFLLSKSAKPAPKKKPQGRDLRIPSDGSMMSGHTVTSTVPSTLKTGHALAMRSARAPVPRNGGAANTAERRIMSLNHISHNQPPITTMIEKPSLLTVSSNGLANMKRSQSVKNAVFHRKTSWAPGKRNVSISSIHNKENEETLSEEEEEYSQATESRIDELASDAGTEQHYRHSVSNTDARDSMSYATGSYLSDGEEDEHAETVDDDRRTSYGTYESGTGSYLTQSELDRHPSVGSSAKGTLGTSTAAVIPEDMMSDLEPPPRFTNQGMVKFAPPSDSGLGTDLQSGQSGAEEEYVRRR